MDTSIICAIVSAIATILAVIIGQKCTRDKVQQTLEITNAVQNEKIEQLTIEVRRHNGFAERIPVLETKVENIEKNLEK